jgi:8-amino-7-oxononanoate synthase
VFFENGGEFEAHGDTFGSSCLWGDAIHVAFPRFPDQQQHSFVRLSERKLSSSTVESQDMPATIPVDQPDLDQLCQEAVRLTDRNYLLQTHRSELAETPTDLFAKARVYSDSLTRVQELAAIPFGHPITSAPGPRVTMEFSGRPQTMVMFASNDYLNLSTHPAVQMAVTDTVAELGVGAGSSRVNAGFSQRHHELEAKLADAFQTEAAILFPTGFDAVSTPPQCLLTKDDRVIIDGSSHACIHEGSHFSGATVRVFAHNNPQRLEETLQLARRRSPNSGLLVMIEGAYSMDGDIARLPEIVDICHRHGARILIDEAHSIGVHGPTGLGVCEHFGLQSRVDMIAGTFSKSLGATGGFVAGTREVIRYLNYTARRIVFSAAMPPILVAAVDAALDIVRTDPQPRERLWSNIRYLSRGLQQAGACLLGNDTASIPVLIGDDGLIFRFTRELIARGVFTYPAVFPTVPKNRSLLRLAVQADHSREDLDHTISVFGQLLRKYKLCRSEI